MTGNVYKSNGYTTKPFHVFNSATINGLFDIKMTLKRFTGHGEIRCLKDHKNFFPYQMLMSIYTLKFKYIVVICKVVCLIEVA